MVAKLSFQDHHHDRAGAVEFPAPARARRRCSQRLVGIASLNFVLCLALLAAVCAAPAYGVTVALGGNHSMLLRDDGTLWAWGSNAYGQLGDGSNLGRAVPTQVLSGVRAIAAGRGHSVALKTDGTVWAWGDNVLGQLGDGTTINRAVPAQVFAGVRAIAAGGHHTLALKADGTLWAWGWNNDSQLGDGTTELRASPVPVKGLNDVVDIAAGGYHSLVLTTGGTLWAWGGNAAGQLGDGTTASRASPVAILNAVSAVAAGYEHSLALKADGTLWAWGRNEFSQLGDGSSSDRASPVLVLGGVGMVAAGESFSLALKTDGRLWGWGANGSGQLGDGTTDQRAVPALSMSGIGSVAAGAHHAVAVKIDGTQLAWGENSHGQLGDGATVHRAVPVEVLGAVQGIAGGGDHSLAIKTGSTLWAWGDNSTGQLGDGTSDDRAAPVQVALPGAIRAAATGFDHSLAIKTDGTLWAWGGSGEVGGISAFDQTVPSQVLSGMQGVSAGSFHTLALASDGTLRAWGSNDYGQLGDGTFVGRSAPVTVSLLNQVQAIAAGGEHSVSVRTDGTVWAWGHNLYGQLGDGTTTDREAPVRVPGLGGVVTVATGGDHTLALAADGSLWAWGHNSSGQLGDGTTEYRTAPVTVLSGVRAMAAGSTFSVALKTDGTLWSWGVLAVPGHAGGAQLVPLQNPFLRNITRVAAGGSHALAVTADGRVLTWGSNEKQQLGIARSPYSATPQAVRDPLVAYAGADLVVEYFNPTIKNGAGTSGIGHYFITAASAEAASIDAGGSGPGWARTGRTFRAWNDPAKAPAGAVGVCRFYARVPNSHFYTASAAECQSLKNQNPSNNASLGWSYEGIAFYTVLPGGGNCGAGYHPVYRSYNSRFNPDPALNDGNHRITPSYNDYQRSIRFFGYADEGIAFCSPASTNPGGDLQVTYSYPGATVQSGALIAAEFLFGNNGAGKGDGGSIYLALPAEVANWNVTCVARNGAACPSTGDLIRLREGQAIAAWPAGGTLDFTATGTAPAVSTGSEATLHFAATVANASGSPDATPANDTPPLAQTVVKAVAVCNTVANPSALQLGPAAQTPRVNLIVGNGCAWSAQSSVAWLTVTPASGTGDATLTLALAANTTTSERNGIVTVGGKTIVVAQSGTPAASGSACATLRMQREGDQVAPGGLTGALSFGVIADSQCAWRAQSNASWVTLTAGSGSSGNGTVSYLVESNNDLQPRNGTLTVGAKLFTINQLGNAATDNGGDSGGDGGGGSSGGGSSGGGAG